MPWYTMAKSGVFANSLLSDFLWYEAWGEMMTAAVTTDRVLLRLAAGGTRQPQTIKPFT